MPTIAAMEPTQIRSEIPEFQSLSDLAWELGRASGQLANPLQASAVTAVGNLVRSMNCYYSNLIEGHNTMPIDIDRALENDFAQDPAQRDLQQEALAHIQVQSWIDQGGLDGTGFGVDGIREVHRRFYEAMPERLHWVTHPASGDRRRVIPGEYRDHDVQVGNHIPCAPEQIPQFMGRWEAVYAGLKSSQFTMALAAAHHRLLWIHPFADGNGRVARLITHAMMRHCLDGTPLWSVSRGFARTRTRYRYLLTTCDQPRRGDLDGRGQLSESSLVGFSRYFLETSLDQVHFMSRILQQKDFTSRLFQWIYDHERTHADAMVKILKELLLFGQVNRGEVPSITGLVERTSRRVVKSLLEDHHLLVAKTSKAPLELNIPLHLAESIFPGLIPENAPD